MFPVLCVIMIIDKKLQKKLNRLIAIDKKCTENILGYKPYSTYSTAFLIADTRGVSDIELVYNMSFEQATVLGYKFLTELVLILEEKTMEHFLKNQEYHNLYLDLWKKADEHAVKTLTGTELDYYFNMTRD